MTLSSPTGFRIFSSSSPILPGCRDLFVVAAEQLSLTPYVKRTLLTKAEADIRFMIARDR